MPLEYKSLESRTQARLMERWPNATFALLSRFALLAQQYRELKTEFELNERRYALENDVTLVEPYLAPLGCATALCAAQGERPAHECQEYKPSKMHRAEGKL